MSALTIIGTVWGGCFVAFAVLLYREHRTRSQTKSEPSPGQPVSGSVTAPAAGGTGGMPPARLFVVAFIRPVPVSRVLADCAFTECELTDRMPCYGLPDDEEAVSLALDALRGRGGRT